MMRFSLLLASLLLIAGCDNRPEELDAGARTDASLDGGASDAGPRTDSGAMDAGTGIDSGAGDAGGSDSGASDSGPGADDSGPPDSGPPDSGPPDSGPPDSGPPDAGTPARSDHHIHIEVSNTCVMTVTPREITIPAGQTAYFDWHNHSRDYAVDVWMSYGGGYTDLPTGATWDEPIGHCGTPFVGDEYADISTACDSFRFLIHCN